MRSSLLARTLRPSSRARSARRRRRARLRGSLRPAGIQQAPRCLPRKALRLVKRLEAPVCDLGPSWEAAYTSRLSSKARSERRGACASSRSSAPSSRRWHAAGGDRESVEDAFVVHELRWRGRRDASGFITETGKRFHRAALLALADQDVARGLTIRLDGRPIAFSLYLQLAGRSYGMNMAFDPAYAAYGPGGRPSSRRSRRPGRKGSGASRCWGLPPSTSGGSRTASSRSTKESASPGPGEAAPQRRRSWAGSASGAPQAVEDRKEDLQPRSASARASDRRAPSTAARPTVEASSAPGPRASPRTGSSTASGGCGEAAESGGAGAARTAAEDLARCTAERSRTTGR